MTQKGTALSEKSDPQQLCESSAYSSIRRDPDKIALHTLLFINGPLERLLMGIRGESHCQQDTAFVEFVQGCLS